MTKLINHKGCSFFSILDFKLPNVGFKDQMGVSLVMLAVDWLLGLNDKSE